MSGDGAFDSMSERSFEVYGDDGARWLIDSVHDYKRDAVRRCEELAADPNNSFVRLQVREEGRFKNRAVVVHEQECARDAGRAVQVQPVDEAPYCKRLIDYYALQARRVVARLLRPFLDREGITALELLHDYPRLRRLLRDDNAYPQALSRVAAIQAKDAGVTTAQRSEELDQAVEALVRRARYDDTVDDLARTLEAEGLAAMWAAIPAEIKPAERTVKTQAALTRYLRYRGGWAGKLGALLELIPPDRDAAVLETVDGAVADLLESREAVREIVGGSANLGGALTARIRVARGQAPGTEGADPVADRLAAAMPDLPQSHDCLLEAVSRGLATTQPLTKEGGEAERKAFRRIVEALTSAGGLIGGPAMADGVTRRARTVFARDDEDLSPADGAKTVTRMLHPRSVQVGYLLALAASPFGRRYRNVMMKILAGMLKGLTGRRGLLPDDATEDVSDDMVREIKAHIAALEAGEAGEAG